MDRRASRVIDPALRIADLRREGRRAWPAPPVLVSRLIQSIASMLSPIRGEQIGDELFHARLRLGREVGVDVELAERFADRRFRRTPTPRFQRGRFSVAAAQRRADEGEARVDEVLGEIRAYELEQAGARDRPSRPAAASSDSSCADSRPDSSAAGRSRRRSCQRGRWRRASAGQSNAGRERRKRRDRRSGCRS